MLESCDWRTPNHIGRLSGTHHGEPAHPIDLRSAAGQTTSDPVIVNPFLRPRQPDRGPHSRPLEVLGRLLVADGDGRPFLRLQRLGAVERGTVAVQQRGLARVRHESTDRSTGVILGQWLRLGRFAGGRVLSHAGSIGLGP